MRFIITSQISLTVILLLMINPATAGRILSFIEMGESGQAVSFPMTADEIAAEDAEIARLKALHDSKVSKKGSEAVRFELAESGETIEFPAKGMEILPESTVKAGATMEGDEENILNNKSSR